MSRTSGSPVPAAAGRAAPTRRARARPKGKRRLLTGSTRLGRGPPMRKGLASGRPLLSGLHRRLEDLHPLVDLLRAHHERRDEPDRVPPRSQDHEPAPERLFDDGVAKRGVARALLGVLHELRALHEPEAAHIADPRVVLLDLLEPLAQELTLLRRILDEALLLDRVEGRERRGAGDGVAA